MSPTDFLKSDQLGMYLPTLKSLKSCRSPKHYFGGNVDCSFLGLAWKKSTHTYFLWQFNWLIHKEYMYNQIILNEIGGKDKYISKYIILLL